ncbi:MAG: sigma factor for late transcription, partial [Methylophagaceae bacterium]
MAARAKVKPEHYVDNKKLFVEMCAYLELVKEAAEADDKRPRIPEYIGECLLKISSRLSTKPNFINYTYRDEMISDGIENCVNYIGNFNPEKSQNPFAYFTQIIYYAFLRRIQREKKQLYIKHKSLETAIVQNEL